MPRRSSAAREPSVGTGRGLVRQLVSGAGWSLAGRLSVAGLGLVTSALLTRTLDAGQMGLYLLAASAVATAGVVAGVGVNQLSTRYVAEHVAEDDLAAARYTVERLLRLGIAASSAVGVVCALGVAAVAGGLAPETRGALLAVLLGGWVVLTAVQALVADSFRGLSDIRAASLVGGPLASLLIVVGLAAAVTTGIRFGLTGALLVVVAGSAVNVGGAVAALSARIKRLPSSDVRPERLHHGKVLAVSAPLVSTTLLLMVLGSVDLWVLGASRPAEEVAAYGVAARTATLVGMPLLVVHGVLAPRIAGMYAAGDGLRLERLLRTAATVAAAPAAALVVVFATAGGQLLALVYGQHYRSGGLTLAVLSVGQLVNVSAGLCGLVLAMTGHQRVLLRITALTLLATVALLAVAVPGWGAPAAALVAALGLAAQNIWTAAATRRLTGMSSYASPLSVVRAVRGVPR